MLVQELGVSGNPFDVQLNAVQDPAMRFDATGLDLQSMAIEDILARTNNDYQIYQLPDGRDIFVLPDSTVLMTTQTDPTAAAWTEQPGLVVSPDLGTSSGVPAGPPLGVDPTLVGFYSDQAEGTLELKIGIGEAAQTVNLSPKQLKTMPLSDFASQAASVETSLPGQPDAPPIIDTVLLTGGKIYRVFYDFGQAKYRIAEANL